MRYSSPRSRRRNPKVRVTPTQRQRMSGLVTGDPVVYLGPDGEKIKGTLHHWGDDGCVIVQESDGWPQVGDVRRVKGRNPIYRARHRKPGTGVPWGHAVVYAKDMDDAEIQLMSKYSGENIDVTGIKESHGERFRPLKRKVRRMSRRRKNNPRSRKRSRNQKKWIKGAIKRPGALRARFKKWYKLKDGQKITPSMYKRGLKRAQRMSRSIDKKRAAEGRRIRSQIRLAQRLSKMAKKRTRKRTSKVVGRIGARRRLARKAANPRRRKKKKVTGRKKRKVTRARGRRRRKAA